MLPIRKNETTQQIIANKSFKYKCLVNSNHDFSNCGINAIVNFVKPIAGHAGCF